MYKIFIKRVFDFFISLLALSIFSPICIATIVVLYLQNKGKPFFFQERPGLQQKPFKIIKFKTMTDERDAQGNLLPDVERITKFGGVVRKFSVDELPQLINVLKGEMSLVGPRPDLPGYADQLEGDDRLILKVRPGITGPATLKYKNEDQILRNKNNPQQYNDEVIWPDKVAINKEYILNWTFLKDLKYIYKSVIYFK